MNKCVSSLDDICQLDAKMMNRLFGLAVQRVKAGDISKAQCPPLSKLIKQQNNKHSKDTGFLMKVF